MLIGETSFCLALFGLFLPAGMATKSLGMWHIFWKGQGSLGIQGYVEHCDKYSRLYSGRLAEDKRMLINKATQPMEWCQGEMTLYMRSLVSLSLKITLRNKSKNNTKLCSLLCDCERFIMITISNVDQSCHSLLVGELHFASPLQEQKYNY